VTVRATDAEGATYDAITDGNGHYLIEVPPGTYTVAPVDPPAGYTATSTVPYGPKVMLAGEQYLDADFGYDSPLLGTIGNLVWEDLNKDGAFDPASEEPIGGVSVDLIRDLNGDGVWDSGEPIIATATTTTTLGAVNGNYLFTGLTATTCSRA
jgi:hypothetical protein